MVEKETRKTLRHVVTFTICIVICVTIIGLIAFRFLETSSHQEARDKLEEEAENYVNRINRQISQNFQLLKTSASVIGETGLYTNENFTSILKEACQENNFVTMGFFDMNEVGRVVTENETEENVKLETIDSKGQESIRRTLTGEKAVSHVLHGEYSQQRVFIFSVPVYSPDGELAGALFASDLVEVFSEITDGEKILDGNAYIHLISSHGKFLLRSAYSVAEENMETIFEAPYFQNGEELETVKERMEKYEQVTFEFAYDGEAYYSLMKPLGFNGWYLLCINSVENSNLQIYGIARLLSTCFFALVIVITSILLYVYNAVNQGNKKLTEVVYKDHLTGIYNLRGFCELVGERIKERPECTVVILNVRKFKFVNELFGKEGADELLISIAQVLQGHIHEQEYVCRDTADMFYIYMKETDQNQIETRLKEISDSITQKAAFITEQYQLKFCYGGVLVNEKITVQQILTRTMFALERAKKNSHQNSIWFFDTQLHEQEKMENYLENRMYRALETGEFKLYLQPKFSLRDNTLSGAEALVRWIEDDGTTHFPSQFIPLFEQNGFCVQLDMYMIKKACQLLREWMDAGYTPIPISLNQSKQVFYENQYVERICSILEEYQIPPNLIILEILEEMVIDNIELFNEKLNQLKNIGFKISMDDFGTGYTSLNILGKLKIDELKVDREFLNEARNSEDKTTRLILEEIVQLSKRISVSTVIEGVETEEDDLLIKQIGCDYGQGYYYSRPVSAGEFTTEILLKK